MLIRMKKIIKLIILSSILFGCAKQIEIEKPEIINPPLEESKPLRLYFSLDGIDYQFPLKVKDFIDKGWKPTVSIDSSIDPNTFIPNYYFRNGTSIVKVSIYNPTSEAKMLDEVLISELGFENRTFKGDVAPNILVNDILDFNTNIETINDIFGEPSYSEDAVFEYYDYEINNKNFIRVEKYKDRRDGDVNRWIYIRSYVNE